MFLLKLHHSVLDGRTDRSIPITEISGANVQYAVEFSNQHILLCQMV